MERVPETLVRRRGDLIDRAGVLVVAIGLVLLFRHVIFRPWYWHLFQPWWGRLPLVDGIAGGLIASAVAVVAAAAASGMHFHWHPDGWASSATSSRTST